MQRQTPCNTQQSAVQGLATVCVDCAPAKCKPGSQHPRKRPTTRLQGLAIGTMTCEFSFFSSQRQAYHWMAWVLAAHCYYPTRGLPESLGYLHVSACCCAAVFAICQNACPWRARPVTREPADLHIRGLQPICATETGQPHSLKKGYASPLLVRVYTVASACAANDERSQTGLEIMQCFQHCTPDSFPMQPRQ